MALSSGAPIRKGKVWFFGAGQLTNARRNVTLDVTHESAGAKVRELILKYGPFYGLVNNAGIAVGGPFEEQSERDVRDQFETNVFGLMTATRAKGEADASSADSM